MSPFGDMLPNSRNTVTGPIQPTRSLNIGTRGPLGRSLEPRWVLSELGLSTRHSDETGVHEATNRTPSAPRQPSEGKGGNKQRAADGVVRRVRRRSRGSQGSRGAQGVGLKGGDRGAGSDPVIIRGMVTSAITRRTAYTLHSHRHA